MASYEQNKSSKLWSVRFRIVDETGEHNKRLSGFRRKADAETAYREFMQTYIKPVRANKKGDEITFGQIYSAYQSYLSLNAKESTQYALAQIIQSYVLPQFKNTPISKIDKAALEAWQKELWLRTDLKYSYKKNIRGRFNSVLLYGNKEFDTPPSPFKKMSVPKNFAIQKEEMQIWTTEEFQQFSSCIERQDCKVYFRTLYLTGMRKGEALALTIDDFDYASKVLKVIKTKTKKRINKSGPGYRITSPKTLSSNRTIRIPDSLADDIQALIQEKSGPYIFGNENPLPESTIDRSFIRAIEKSGVKRIRIHDLRHSHASLLLSNGVNIVAVAKRLGHSNITQTLNTYAHIMPKDDDLILSTLNKCT